MPKAIDLLHQGRHEELWQMCCGFLKLDIHEFMELQENLLLQQLELLEKSPLGKNVMRGASPGTVEEFRRQVPLTSYKDYCPELLEKKEDILPAKPEIWAHSSGRSGDFPCKWVPLSAEYLHELSKVLYGVGMLSCANSWGDVSRIPGNIKLLYGVAPRPYISGTFADVLRMQSPFKYLPDLEKAEKLTYEERIAAGFKQALSEGIDYFFGLSLVLVKVGEKLRESSSKIDIRQFLTQPRALWRLAGGLIKSKLAGRQILPRDIWSLKGIIGSGVDSGIYKNKVKELWGRTPLDIYSCTEGGVIATQAWNCEGLTFIPTLNFYEFIPEEECLKWQLDRSYKMKTLLLDEVKAGENYEIVITNLHGGVLTRYRVGDMIHITALRDEKAGINLPQMAFERRTSDIVDFVSVRFTEKLIWQAVESSGIPYNDWIAYKIPGEPVLHLLIEPKTDFSGKEPEIAASITKQMLNSGKSGYKSSGINEDWRNELDFSVEVSLLAKGTFDRYTAQKQSGGADLAHLKPPHLNPSDQDLSLLLEETGDAFSVVNTGSKT